MVKWSALTLDNYISLRLFFAIDYLQGVHLPSPFALLLKIAQNEIKTSGTLSPYSINKLYWFIKTG